MGKILQRRSLSPWRLLPVIAGFLMLVRCDDGPTGPSVRSAPTPVPVPNVAGTWQGHTRTDGPAILCGGGAIPTSATFAQEGARVTGSVRTPRNGSTLIRSFEGTLQGSQITGTLADGGTMIGVSGTASPTNMTLRFGSRDGPFCGVSIITLFR
jgi:hypothetical protein